MPDAHVSIGSPDVTPDSYTKSFIQTDYPTVSFIENSALREQFPGEYHLSSGRWPQAAFAVAISPHLASALGNPKTFTALSGRATFHVVGIVEDDYERHGDLILAGPGTWERISRPAAARAYAPVDAEVSVSWGNRGSRAAVAQVLSSILPPLPAGQGSRAEEVRNNYETRAQIARTTVPGFGMDVVVSYLPLGLVVLLVVALVVRQVRGDHLENTQRLVAVGVPRGASRLTQAIALSLGAAVGVVGGLAAGWLIAVAMRFTVLPRFADQPLSPLPAPSTDLLLIALMAVTLVTGGTMWPEHTRLVKRELPAKATFALATIRLGCAALLLLAGIKIASGDYSARVAAIVVYLPILAVALLSPEFLRALLATLNRNRPRTFVARRLITAERSRYASAIAVVICCVAVPACAATRIVSQQASEAAANYGLVPAHQIWVQRGDGNVDGIREVGRTVGAVPGTGRPILVRSLSAQQRLRHRTTAYAHYRVEPTSEDFNSTTLVLTDARDLRRLVGAKLDRRAERTLTRGGLVNFTNAVGNEQFVVDLPNGRQKIVRDVLDTKHVRLAPRFSQHYAGAILLRTARQLGLPVRDPTMVVFTGVTGATVTRAVAAAVDAGFDSRFVQYNVSPPGPDIPTSWWVFLAILVLGGFIVLLLVIRGQAMRLRSYSARLVSIGLSPPWILSVLAIQAAVVIGIGLLAGVAGGIVGIAFVADAYVRPEVPVLPVVLSAVGVVVATGVATASGMRTLTAVGNAGDG